MYSPSFSSYNKNTARYLIEGIIKSRTVNLKDVVTKVNCSASPDSLYRRFQRFFQKEMEFCGIGVFLLQSFLKMCLITIPSPVKIYLSIDRHQWSYGSKVNNLLVAHIYEPITGIDFPVSVIDLNRRGSSDTLERGDIIAHLFPILQPLIYGGKLIVTVLGDREFFSHDWISCLISNSLNYKLRMKRSTLLSSGDSIKNLYSGLDVNETIEASSEDGRIVIKRLDEVSGRRDACLAVLTNDYDSDCDVVLDDYGIRWKIERAFFNIESNGWELKKTHLKCSKRVEMMFYILIACYFLSVVFGYIQSRLRAIKIKKHGYKSITLFLSGRRLIDELFTKNVVSSLKCIITTFNLCYAKLCTNGVSEIEYCFSYQGVV